MTITIKPQLSWSTCGGTNGCSCGRMGYNLHSTRYRLESGSPRREWPSIYFQTRWLILTCRSRPQRTPLMQSSCQCLPYFWFACGNRSGSQCLVDCSVRSEGQYVSERVYDGEFGGVSGGDAEDGSKGEYFQDEPSISCEIPRAQQMPKPISLSVKVSWGKHDSSSSSFFVKMFLNSIYNIYRWTSDSKCSAISSSPKSMPRYSTTSKGTTSTLKASTRMNSWGCSMIYSSSTTSRINCSRSSKAPNSSRKWNIL